MSETSDWVRSHKCTYDIQSVMEVEEGAASHVGFELNLHAELPAATTSASAIGGALDEIRDKLGEILESLIPRDAKAKIERVPFRRAVRYPKGAGENPFVTRTVRVFLPEYATPEPDDRAKFGPTEKRLTEMGFTKA